MSFCDSTDARRVFTRRFVRFVTLVALILAGVPAAGQTARTPNTPPPPMPAQPAVPETLPHDVLERVSANKANGLPLYDGVVKAYTIDIPVCIDEAATSAALNFLTALSGFDRVEFISNGKVLVVTAVDLSSVALKQALHENGIAFQFINEVYIVNE